MIAMRWDVTGWVDDIGENTSTYFRGVRRGERILENVSGEMMGE